ncbi:site-2 protease family protein [Candidatus Saccharibacteria bacterium]|nr:site-2 protease family protein [Candidatus Saccharibacteria bacterium]
MTLHEAMHAFMSYWLGDDTAKSQGRLTLNPIKHIDPFLTILLPLILAISGGPIFGGAKPVPFNPHRVKYGEWGAALVALAGPLTNFFIAFILFGAMVLLNINPISGAGSVIMLAVSVNLGFFVFNMIPIPPLDGSRVLYALAPDFVRRGMEAVEQYGIFLVFLIVVLASTVIGKVMSVGIGAVLQLFFLIFGIS